MKCGESAYCVQGSKTVQVDSYRYHSSASHHAFSPFVMAVSSPFTWFDLSAVPRESVVEPVDATFATIARSQHEIESRLRVLDCCCSSSNHRDSITLSFRIQQTLRLVERIK